MSDKHLRAAVPPAHAVRRDKDAANMVRSKKHYGKPDKQHQYRSHTDIPLGKLGHSTSHMKNGKKRVKHIKAVREGNIKAVKPLYH